jgi:hypothetical protein
MGFLLRLVFGGLVFLARSNQRDVAAAGAVGGITPGIIALAVATFQRSADGSGFFFFGFAFPALIAGAFLGAFAGWLLRKMMGEHDLEWAEINAAFLAGLAAGAILLLLFFPGMDTLRIPFLTAR